MDTKVINPSFNFESTYELAYAKYLLSENFDVPAKDIVADNGSLTLIAYTGLEISAIQGLIDEVNEYEPRRLTGAQVRDGIDMIKVLASGWTKDSGWHRPLWQGVLSKVAPYYRQFDTKINGIDPGYMVLESLAKNLFAFYHQK